MPSDRELRRAAARPAEDRYTYTRQRIYANDGVWVLAKDNGLCILGPEVDDRRVMVWPEADCADAWALDAELDGEDVVFIPLPDWIESTLPGLQADTVEIEVFPTDEEDGWIVDAAAMREDLLARR